MGNLPMQPEEALRQSLVDFKLSKGERRQLQELLLADGITQAESNQWRNLAFAIATTECSDANSKPLFKWLLEVLRAIDSASSTLQSQANTTTSVCEVHFGPGERCRQAIESRIRTCRQTLDICVFTITDDLISKAILDAHQRQVAVRLISDNDKMNDLGSDIDKLRIAGVPVRLDNSQYHMHHKFAIFDGKLLLNGSYNWTLNAARENEENFILTNEPKLLQAFAEQFEQLWQQFA